MNSWQQPVSGEPSLGTLHWISSDNVGTPALSTDPGDTNIHALDLSSLVPQGTKAVVVVVNVTGTSANVRARIYDKDGTTLRKTITTQVANQMVEYEGIAYLDSSRNMYWGVNNTAVSALKIWVEGYYC